MTSVRCRSGRDRSTAARADAAGFGFIVTSPRTRNQRRCAGADRHHHALQREEHALSRADRRKRLGAELADDFRLNETDDAIQQIAENRR